jgi:hypothetical protein
MKLIAIAVVAFVAFFFSTPADARHHKHHTQAAHHHGHIKHHHRVHVAESSAAVVGGRPEGCPSAFCGCGASLYLFGKIIEPLNRAAEWIERFPRAEPAPGMAAARRHHVMVLIEHRHDDVWLVHDSNYSHKTLVHERSISGYTVVNPQQNVQVASADHTEHLVVTHHRHKMSVSKVSSRAAHSHHAPAVSQPLFPQLMMPWQSKQRGHPSWN